MNHVFPRHTKTSYPSIAGGKGCYLVDSNGKQYLDGSGGAAISCLGHGDEEIIEATKSQLDSIAFAHTRYFTSPVAEELADWLANLAPGSLDRVYFVSGGSEAVEAALKLARQYHLEKGQPQRRLLISRQQSYHGNTLGALAAGGNEWRRAQFEPLLIDVAHIAPCYAYRDQREDESEEDYGLRAANELENKILELGPQNVMAFIAEPVVGATMGAVPPVKGYFRRIREICDQHGVLLILDEVMCGMGRTGSLFACEQDGVAPDIVTIAKGLGAGYQPIGAMMCSAEIYQAIEQGSAFFQHGHSYLAHPAACAASLAVMRAFENRKLIERVQVQGEKLQSALVNRFGQHPNVGDVRGRGLFRGVELVADRESKETFDPQLAVHNRVYHAAMDAGLICYPMGGTIDGKNGDHVLLAPPFIIEDHQIDELVDKLDHAIGVAVAGA